MVLYIPPFEQQSNTAVAFANAHCLNMARTDTRVRSSALRSRAHERRNRRRPREQAPVWIGVSAQSERNRLHALLPSAEDAVSK
jgi:hypothetical protein